MMKIVVPTKLITIQNVTIDDRVRAIPIPRPTKFVFVLHTKSFFFHIEFAFIMLIG
jgi:hypothetical protein